MTPIATDTAKYIKFLKDGGLLTDEHALTVALLNELVKQLPNATNATQFAALSKEIRATQDALPKPAVTVSDDAQDFLDELEGLANE